ncbi:N-acetyllactosaminide beta-1,3-N-acetylglucosaminyltransferase 2-like [Megalops cyprinoides]|uniref:N-acetyllactosaminide beta-1,3-N-acetylglucosaminyltransferase 2-like n=1 Tax=Megalops cyprinoides TaxID=118141 RepID=UPI001863FEA4|nr:N-acetyllactosaminide beta-1,3-N-acetylglucosaminyltransferase 2-like [Megalops cyprinoides]XP_036402416.1 N-acetyllactosaminide beta-1,3-N-acetylglucosaminyltransferase 2-like [Megalops cyprinoides]XP_036402418.1 N-acetyllactosaminide beta-1,3-N-acetylglucosaminyltransferase 2-like [Megalops cyprinoides]XP_036402419.1 N-acetyllactosaminide beta-1,3-N-acetylglucosaminyltransferase 2-like [Megalops cyprinoides]XP_036402420.1 N-acetyllactosaminide beta-1,3-N-acetylglucosaminyltransferase 2-lik
MAQARRKVKLLGVMMMVNFFIYIVVEVARSSSQGKGGQDKVHIPTEKFWKKLAVSEAYWNREQQRLDFIHNPILSSENGSASGLPDWLNHTADRNSCDPDLSVTTQVKDYNSLPARFKDFLLYMRCRSYPMVVDQPHVCRDPPFLLLAVKSLAPHFDRRQAIRESWGRAGKLANRTVATVFLLGNATAMDHFPDLSGMLRHENRLHRDLLQWDYRDTFFNLTAKEVLFLDWLHHRCPGASFVFKGDDDVFVNTHRILDFLAGLPPAKAKDLFVGDVITNAGPHRDKRLKYFIPESLYVGPYPPYAGGGGFLYSGDLALRLRNISARVPLYPIDDVYTGMCLRKLGLAPEKHKGFRTFDIEEKYRSNACAYKSLMLVHSRTPQEMIKIWAWLSDPDLSCQ